MPETRRKTAIVIRDLDSFEDLSKVEALEKEVWGLEERDLLPLTMTIASRAAGNIWVGAFDGAELIGFAFGLLGMEDGHVTVHSHMLAVKDGYRDDNVGYKLKLAQRERALAMRIREMSWTFDPLQSKNAHLNFAKLGAVSNSYRVDFYGPETSSKFHRNSTDRLWVTWPMTSRRVQQRLQGMTSQTETMDALSRLQPLIRFNGDGKPVRTDLGDALSRQRIASRYPATSARLRRRIRRWRGNGVSPRGGPLLNP